MLAESSSCLDDRFGVVYEAIKHPAKPVSFALVASC